MSLKNFFFQSKITRKIYLYYNLYVRHKCFINRTQYSQWGEDIIISEFFKNKDYGTYFDIGCFHPYMYSNTCLLHKKGWAGINIDINQTSIDLFKISRPKDLNLCTTINDTKKKCKIYFDHPFSPVNTLDKRYFKDFKKDFFKTTSIKSVWSMTVDEILNLSGVNNIDYINIDVEGMDYKILNQLIPKKLKPQLISIETHSVDGSKAKDSDKIMRLLNENDFKVLKRVGPTTIFKT